MEPTRMDFEFGNSSHFVVNNQGTPSTATLHLASSSISSSEAAAPSATSRPPSNSPPTPNPKKVVSHRKHLTSIHKRLTSIRWSARAVHIALTATATFSAILFSLALSWKYVVPTPYTDFDIPLLGDPLRKVGLTANFISLDPTAGSLTVDWYPLPFNCDEPEAIINFYFDPNLLVTTTTTTTTSSVRSDAPPTTPTFQFNTSSRCNPGLRDSFPVFQTSARTIGVQNSNTEIGGLTEGSLELYPFDKYLIQFSIFAEVNKSNEAVGIIFLQPWGVPVNFNLALNSLASNQPEILLVSMYATRSVVVKILAILIVCANWSVTIAFVYITTACLVWRDENIVAQLFVLPIGALFGFTAVRSNLPGAPTGFGAFIDFVGILPNLAVITLCSAVLLFLVLWRRIRSHAPRDEEAAKHVMGVWRQCSRELAQDEKAVETIVGIWRHIQDEIEKKKREQSP